MLVSLIIPSITAIREKGKVLGALAFLPLLCIDIVILPLFVMPICDFAPDLGIRHLYLIKYIWPNLQLFQFRFNIKKIFKILAVP